MRFGVIIIGTIFCIVGVAWAVGPLALLLGGERAEAEVVDHDQRLVFRRGLTGRRWRSTKTSLVEINGELCEVSGDRPLGERVSVRFEPGNEADCLDDSFATLFPQFACVAIGVLFALAGATRPRD